MEFSEIKQLVKDGVIDDKPDKALFSENISKLIESGFVGKTNKDYQFINHLTWEVVYETLLYSERRHLHDLIAKHIEKANTDNIENVASRLFYHYDKSENYKKMVFYASLSGDKASSLYAIDDAIEFYNLAIGALDKINIKTNVEYSVLNEKIADTLKVSGQYGAAVDSYSKSLDVWQSAKRNNNKLLTPWAVKYASRLSLLHHKLAVVNEQMCSYDSANQWLNYAEEELPLRPGNLKTKINATRSAIYYRKGEYSESIKYANEALSISNKLKSKRDIAYAYNMLANSYTATGKYNESIKCLDSAIKIYKDIEDYPGLGITYQNMGNGYGFLGDLDKAGEFYNKALDINKKIQNSSSISIIHYCLGDISLYKKEIDTAFKHFNYVLEKSEEEDIRQDLIGVTLYKISMAYFHNNDLDRCEDYIQQSLSVLSDTQATNFLMEAKLMLSELRYEQLRFDESMAICDEILSIAIPLDMNIYNLKALKLYADCYTELGDHESAHEKYDEYLSRIDNFESNHEAALAILKKASLPDIHLHENDEMIAMLNHAIKTFSEYSDDGNRELAEKLLNNINDK